MSSLDNTRHGFLWEEPTDRGCLLQPGLQSAPSPAERSTLAPGSGERQAETKGQTGCEWHCPAGRSRPLPAMEAAPRPGGRGRAGAG